jgi:hypothetical protein
MNEVPAEDIREITDPGAFPLVETDWTPWFGVLGAVAAAVLLVLAAVWLAWLILRAKPVRHRQAALRRLEGMRADVAHLEANQFATHVLRVLREYYHNRYGDTVLFETRPEFARREAAKGSMDPERKQRLESLLERCDSVQFGGAPLPPERRPLLLDEAMELLRSEPPDAVSHG